MLCTGPAHYLPPRGGPASSPAHNHAPQHTKPSARTSYYSVVGVQGMGLCLRAQCLVQLELEQQQQASCCSLILYISWAVAFLPSSWIQSGKSCLVHRASMHLTGSERVGPSRHKPGAGSGGDMNLAGSFHLSFVCMEAIFPPSLCKQDDCGHFVQGLQDWTSWSNLLAIWRRVFSGQAALAPCKFGVIWLKNSHSSPPSIRT